MHSWAVHAGWMQVPGWNVRLISHAVGHACMQLKPGHVLTMIVCQHPQQVLQRHPQLRSLKLCSCAAVTDAALHALPGESMRQLQLLCCDGVQGWFLQGLPLLQLLHLSSCSAIDPGAIALVIHLAIVYHLHAAGILRLHHVHACVLFELQ